MATQVPVPKVDLSPLDVLGELRELDLDAMEVSDLAQLSRLGKFERLASAAGATSTSATSAGSCVAGCGADSELRTASAHAPMTHHVKRALKLLTERRIDREQRHTPHRPPGLDRG